MSTLKLVLMAIVVVGGIVLWILRNYLSLSVRIERWEEKRDECDEKLEQAISAGLGYLVNELNDERLSISKSLNRLYARQRKSIFHRR